MDDRPLDSVEAWRVACILKATGHPHAEEWAQKAEALEETEKESSK